MNVKFKRFLAFLCIMCTLSLYVRSEVAYCVAGIDDALAIGASLECASGGTLTPIVVGALVAGAIGYGGYQLVNSDYATDFKNYVISSIGIDSFKGMVYIAQDSNGNDYAALSDVGVNTIQSIANSVRDSGFFSVSHSDTTSNTTANTSAPFMLNNIYMTPYTLTNVDTTYDFFRVPSGESLTFQFSSATNSTVTYSITTNNIMYFRVYQVTTYCIMLQSSYDKINWTGRLQILGNPGTYVNFGYKTTSNTVYVPSSSAITGTGIEGSVSSNIGSGSAVAVPISAQYGTSAAQYGCADGTSATVVSGLRVGSDATTGEGAGTATGELTLDGIKDAVREGAQEGTRVGTGEAIERATDIPTDIPNLDFSPLYMDLTKKFPFCVPFDFVNLIKQFQSNAQTPSFHVDFDKNYFRGGGSFDFDFSKVDFIVKIVRYFILLGFVFYLVRKTRSWIGNGGGS